jgi:superfamily I DNA/RNA helicase
MSYSGHYAVIGPPGTGKTTFLARQVRRIVETTGSTRVLVSSLTRTAASEIGGRDLPLPRGSVGTLHAHAFRALDRPEVFAGDWITAWNARRPEFAISGGTSKVREDGELAAEPIADAVDGGERPGDRFLSSWDLVRARRTSLASLAENPGARVFGRADVIARDLVRFVDDFEAWKDAEGLYDFVDLISAARGVPPPLDPEVLVVDEVQDLSSLEWDLVRTWADGRTLFAVGDPWQSLYAWRGADPGLFDEFPEDRLRILSRSWRVPRKIVETGLRWMRGRSNVRKEIRYLPRVDERGVPVDGEIEFDPATTPSRVSAIVDRVEESIRDGRTSMIQATCGYLLGPVVSALRSRGIPFSNPWRASRGDWNPISTRGVSTVERFAALVVPAFERRLWSWREIARFLDLFVSRDVLRHGSKETIGAKASDRFGDRPVAAAEIRGLFRDDSIVDLGEAMIRRDDPREGVRAAHDWTIPRLSRRTVGTSIVFAMAILERFGLRGLRDRPKVFVGTVHSFKGAEADDVHLFSELSSSAVNSIRTGRDVDDTVAAVHRTFYVGITRARSRVFVHGTSSRKDAAIFDVLRKLRNAAIPVA